MMLLPNQSQLYRGRRRARRAMGINSIASAGMEMRPRSCASPFVLAFTLMEFLVATALASLVLAVVATMTIYATRSEIALANYNSLEAKGRYGLDIFSRELRQAQALTAFQTNTFLSFTNAQTAIGVTLTYDPTARTLVLAKTGQAPLTVLTECDRWSFGLYQRTPSVTATNISFVPATNTTGVLDANLCKLVSFTWKCSRTILNQKVNTESVQSAMVVLRNKQ